MKKSVFLLLAIPGLAQAHPGHEAGFHFFFHPGFTLLAGVLGGVVFCLFRSSARKKRTAKVSIRDR